MNFTEINIKPEYRSLSDNVVTDFYIPLLKNAVMYKRAVGFFSSSALVEISKGITGLIKNGGKILLVASPRLSGEDIDAINKGFELRNDVIERALINSFTTPKSTFEEKRLNLLANLVASGKLDIKIAFTESYGKFGMFHEKMGLIYDQDENVVAFAGSMNETSTAFSCNYESIDVFCSWTSDSNRVIAKESAFTAMWEDYESNIRIIDFPDVAKEMFQKYKTSDDIDLEIDHEEYGNSYSENILETLNPKQNTPSIPEQIKLHDYQLEAIENWEKLNYKGIFDMATGTGKTYTGLAAIVRLSEKLNGKLAVIIVCPYQHLVEQWVSDIMFFGMKPISGYSASAQKNWKKRLRDSIIAFNLEIKEHFCFVTTNATFSSRFVQEQIDELNGNVMLMVDEAHNFGAINLSRTLNYKIPYRLALSATLERYGDDEGTQKLLDYFGDKCIEYTLKMAISEDKLTPYYYYPIKVFLTDLELKEYKKLSNQIAKGCHKDKNNKISITDQVKMLLIKRARLVAAASGKIQKLKEQILNYKDDNHILVYCGAASMSDPNYIEGNYDDFEKRQIDVVSDLLGNQLGMRISQFTSAESAVKREQLKLEFDEGRHLQALVAIRCLDEGVNIPSIKLAFILASSTNPKEYVQRRGRVLRKFPGKHHAIIFDFITLPRPLDEVKSLTEDELRADAGLVKREITRMKDFAAIAENSSDTDKLLNEIEDVYDMDKIGGDSGVI